MTARDRGPRGGKRRRSPIGAAVALTALVAASVLGGCASRQELELPPIPPLKRAFLSAEAPGSDLFESFAAPAEDVYQLGPGDRLHIDVWGHEDLSAAHTVGPDGRITVPLVGSFDCAGLTREQTAEAISRFLSRYYKRLAVTVRVDEYASNRVTVLGGVVRPGSYAFGARPTLLAALSEAGGLSELQSGAVPTSCAIVRGREQILWVDLSELLWNSRTELNVLLRAGDVVYVPDEGELLVYVVGEVERPGVVRLTPGMNMVDALARAGGTTIDADEEELRLLRATEVGDRFDVDYEELTAGDLSLDAPLRDGDILHVPRRFLAEWHYFWTRINPFAGFFGTTS